MIGANVLITEDGDVQLCDFGVAGIIESKQDKRSTVIGTPHWMAPELFGQNPSYGKEVDIWAFGCLVYEMATGLPPNVANGYSFERLGKHLQKHVPRLEGGSHPQEIRDLVAFCLEELPSTRPTIEGIQKHPAIYNTETRYPDDALIKLIRGFKVWEQQGGSRKSLFMAGGAQGPSEQTAGYGGYLNEWNFSTTAAFDDEVLEHANAQDVYEAYGPSVVGFQGEASRPGQQKPSRRRPPPEALARFPVPLEKIFDPNTMSNYTENIMNHYGRQQPGSDLPLRDDTAQTSIRDTMIDLGGHDSETGLSSFPDMDTIRADRRGVRDDSSDEYGTYHDFSRPALSDPADVNPNRRTQDWKFPSMVPPASADPEISRFPVSYEPQRPSVTPASGGRPALIHHPTEPVGGFGGMLNPDSSMDRMSLIDLDMSVPESVPDYSRPSTANSDVGSTASAASEYGVSTNPFELERHPSLYLSAPIDLDEADPGPVYHNSDPSSQDFREVSDFSSASETEGNNQSHLRNGSSNGSNRYDREDNSDSDYLSMPPPSAYRSQHHHQSSDSDATTPKPFTMSHFPELPPPPSAAVMAGTATRAEMTEEMQRALAGIKNQLASFRDVYSSPEFIARTRHGGAGRVGGGYGNNNNNNNTGGGGGGGGSVGNPRHN